MCNMIIFGSYSKYPLDSLLLVSKGKVKVDELNRCFNERLEMNEEKNFVARVRCAS